MNNFFDTIIRILKMDERYFTDEGELLRNAVYEDAMRPAPSLIRLLLGNTETKARFFTDIDGTFVFDKVGFAWVIANRELLPDSYTRFKNKIGLADERGERIGDSGSLALVFPYKDCILAGGQTKEHQKRQEIFYNETLAPDEVDYLLYPKALCHAVRHTKDGTESVTEITDTDSLIIKGNNLLVLSSLLKRFAGKVKCIYIDPPYNTGGDSFGYNDKFNHSTWLTFMKNRLDIAKKLLHKSGAIFVHIDYHELGYLIPLMDEVFGKNNCVQIITVKTSSPAGFKTVNPGPIEVTEYILFYTKQREAFEFKKLYVPSAYDTNYDLYIENPEAPPEEWCLEKLYNVIYRQNGIQIGKTPQQSSKNAQVKWGEHWRTIREQLMGRFALENADRIVSVRDPQKPTAELRTLLSKSKEVRNKVFVYEKADGDSRGYVFNGGSLSFYSKKIMDIDGVRTSTELLTGLWTDISWDGIANEGGVTLKNGKKPEKLLRRIIEMCTNPGDVVLDYHAGSGTSGAVAHKTGRQYILVEQLEYIHDLSESRLINVIKGDQTGVSKTVNWQGGGSFIYCEIAEQNQAFANRIQAAGDTDAILALWEDIQSSGYYSYKVDAREVAANIQDFAALSLDNQKRFLMEILDKNLLYVNYCDRMDIDFTDTLTVEDKAFSKSFYKED